jgi:RES domain
VSYPAPPRPFEPLIATLPAEGAIWRCHPLRRGPLEPNVTTSPGRFRPIYDSDGAVVPTCYMADSDHAAIAEGPFHDLLTSPAPKQLPRAISDTLALTPLRTEREVTLVTFRGHGLRRIGETQGSLIEPGPGCYAESAAWGQASYEHPAEPDGMMWASRQFPGGAAMLLFFDRCGDAVRQDGPTLPLAVGRGFELLADAANAAGVVIIES